MPRIRTIKPEFWTDEGVADCSPTARLLFIGLWNFCDDSGIHVYSPKQIKMEIFPGDSLTPDDIEMLLQELIQNKLIKTYHIEDKRYLIIAGWHHQRIEKPNRRYPLPVDFDDHSTTIRRPLGDHSPPDRKGKERKGREGIKEGGNGDAAKAAHFELPTKEEIIESSDPKLKADINKITMQLYEEKIFPDVNAFTNKMLKNKKNWRAILHVLSRCYLSKPEDPWAFCQKIIQLEDLNYNERDYQKTAR